MILLCCKDLSANKAKKMNKALTTKTGKARLQLKGRIFMQNVTETISLQKPGSYTCQIFWKGDPGIENFIIRFNTEDTMKKWATQVDTQRRVWKDHARSSAGTTHTKPSDTQFTYMHDQNLVNPYAEDDEDDDEDVDTVVPGYPPTSSSASIRSRSTTGESVNEATVPPPRFPMGYAQAPLTLRTQQLANSANQDASYFSPVDTPMSTYSNARTSSSSAGTFPFPRQTPPSGYHEENNRYTAPARGHMPRETSMGPGMLPGRAVQRPSLPPTANSASMAAGRLRAASSPDIHNALRPGRQPNSQQPSVPELPPFPTHYAYNAAIVNRSQNNSPNSMPSRAATGSPAIQRDRLVQQRTAEQLANAHPDLPLHYGGPARRDPGATPTARTMTPHSSFERSQGTLTPASMESRTMSPPLSQASTLNENHSGIPTQLKVKVHCPAAGSTMTLVVSTNISFQSLKDRIDAKLQRSTSVSLGSGQVKLKYLDDDTFVTISTDDDLQEAFETWKEQQRDLNPGGQQLGEIELFCQ
jgi:cell division control protein 24